MELNEHPHRRLNVLSGEWILCSPHRAKRPWQGQVEAPSHEERPPYDPGCYLCPGNERAGGIRNPAYGGVFAFDNDFPALVASEPDSLDEEGLLVAESEGGVCRVLCFSPRHDLTIARMDDADIERVVALWMDESRALGARADIGYVQVFENRGAMMGCSNPHPHCQIWASLSVPELPAREGGRQAEWLSGKGSCLLCDYLALERAKGERIVFEDEEWVALVPFWALWPFELMLLPKRHVARLEELDPPQASSLARSLRRAGTRYDNLFLTDFPYSMGFHQAPSDGLEHPEWHLHAHYFPPLLRSATVKKHMVGYELLATAQRDITAESAAERLRGLSETHYRKGNAR
jgi:UDPglucose--hexose-1-phosphate uridylyltransferase